jgi:hypothetical protein
MAVGPLNLHMRHLLSVHVVKPPIGSGLSSLVLIIMSFRFLGRLKAAIGGSLKTLAILSLLYRMARWLLVRDGK